MTSTVPGLTLRQPTGLAPRPTIMLTGQAKTGKSFLSAMLSADPRVGNSYWLDIGEGTADQYGALPGVRYSVAEHDGSYRQLLATVRALVSLPGTDPETGKPNLIIVDSSANLWALLSEHAHKSARDSAAGQRVLRDDPDAEVTVPIGTWNIARGRWAAVIRPLVTWGGIVILTARGKEVTTVGADGRPVLAGRQAAKEYASEAHKSLPFEAKVIVRTIRPGVATLVGAQSAYDLRAEIGREVADFTLGDLIFDVLGCGQGPAGTHTISTGPAESEADALLMPLEDAKTAVMSAAGGDPDRAYAAWAAAQLSVDPLVSRAGVAQAVAALEVKVPAPSAEPQEVPAEQTPPPVAHAAVGSTEELEPAKAEAPAPADSLFDDAAAAETATKHNGDEGLEDYHPAEQALIAEPEASEVPGPAAPPTVSAEAPAAKKAHWADGIMATP